MVDIKKIDVALYVTVVVKLFWSVWLAEGRVFTGYCKSAIFTFDLPSHNHIHIAKHLFFSIWEE